MKLVPVSLTVGPDFEPVANQRLTARYPSSQLKLGVARIKTWAAVPRHVTCHTTHTHNLFVHYRATQRHLANQGKIIVRENQPFDVLSYLPNIRLQN